MLTWHMQHGSSDGSPLMNAENFRTFRDCKMTSSLSPVFTSPILSSSANNSWYRSLLLRRLFPTDITMVKKTKINKWLHYLVRHIINIKPHISVPVVQLSNPVYKWIEEHHILSQSKRISKQLSVISTKDVMNISIFRVSTYILHCKG